MQWPTSVTSRKGGQPWSMGSAFAYRSACPRASTIAIGSGGIFGKGFLNGSQGQLDYLPEGQTDFVFAAMAAKGGKTDRLMIDATHLKAHRTAASLLKKGMFPDVSGAPKAA